MTVAALLADLRCRGVRLIADGDSIRPEPTNATRSQLVQHDDVRVLLIGAHRRPPL